MIDWTAIVIAGQDQEAASMASRLPSFIHPVAGRPLIWHTVQSLVSFREGPKRVVVVAPPQHPMEFLETFGARVEVVQPDAGTEIPVLEKGADSGYLLVDASAFLDVESLRRLVHSEPGAWLGGSGDLAAAILADHADLDTILDQHTPFAVASGRLDPLRRLEHTPAAFVVRTREDLARAHQRVRDGLLRSMMKGGVTFLAPDSVVVDVDVRIGRDTLIYPAVVLEGQTNIGEETVVGPGCRIIDSWIGSGVELKGWNYIAHTSVRNRAILEPYVRRGFS
jgi:bifunctional N-acetylglucosamine-1-phosphate-uridyltransferase/glucosamine-1-phosphate-acetyltransferase GlmU-like protein